jgi:hypothetical protein
LLIIGLPFVKGRDSKKNVKRHGYLTAFALLLHTVLIFAVMIPSFDTNLGVISNLSILGSIDVWSHVILARAIDREFIIC